MKLKIKFVELYEKRKQLEKVKDVRKSKFSYAVGRNIDLIETEIRYLENQKQHRFASCVFYKTWIWNRFEYYKGNIG